MTTRKDDRTPEQRQTHNYGVRMRDAFMSGWGGAKGGNSIALWACKAEHVDAVLRWVEDRKEARNVNVVHDVNAYRCRCVHLHIYVVTEGHPAIRGVPV